MVEISHNNVKYYRIGMKLSPIRQQLHRCKKKNETVKNVVQFFNDLFLRIFIKEIARLQSQAGKKLNRFFFKFLNVRIFINKLISSQTRPFNYFRANTEYPLNILPF